MANRQAERGFELLMLDIEQHQRKGVNQHRKFNGLVLGLNEEGIDRISGEIIFRPMGKVLLSEIVVRFDFDELERDVASPGNYNTGLEMLVEDGSARAFIGAALFSESYQA
jgi:hypothetical protein